MDINHHVVAEYTYKKDQQLDTKKVVLKIQIIKHVLLVIISMMETTEYVILEETSILI
jgi:argininosuccinate lyase